jgi:hypothetical protein
VLLSPIAQAQSPPPAEAQIAAAVTPAPDALQDSASVLGYTDDMTLTTLREGSNEMICLADDPREEGFHAACYHESLEPFMKLGRELRAQGVPNVDSVRRARIEAGTLSMPEQPAALYSLSGPDEAFNPETGEVSGAEPLYVVYAPYETGETTGLPTRPQGGMPWLMEAGQPWAHIMYPSGQ